MYSPLVPRKPVSRCEDCCSAHVQCLGETRAAASNGTTEAQPGDAPPSKTESAKPVGAKKSVSPDPEAPAAESAPVSDLFVADSPKCWHVGHIAEQVLFCLFSPKLDCSTYSLNVYSSDQRISHNSKSTYGPKVVYSVFCIDHSRTQRASRPLSQGRPLPKTAPRRQRTS